MKEKTVIITSSIYQSLETYLDSISYDKLFILVDDITHQKCLPLLWNNGLNQKTTTVIEVPHGDIHKDLTAMTIIWKTLSDQGASRHSLLVNIGGGMITDIGGFAGASFKRGLRTINIPTTLMASVDASIGGKTGCNFNGLKNEIGTFYTPEKVFIDCGFLRTLDVPNLLSGYAEMLKHGLISTKTLLEQTLAIDFDKEIDYQKLNVLVGLSVGIKEHIVAKDPKEQGIRKALNFGHTLGHAYESLSFCLDRPILHGHAVMAGIISELYLSNLYCDFPVDTLRQIVTYAKENYPAFLFDCSHYEKLYEFMMHDKKNEGGHINFTLLGGIGDIRINQQAQKAEIMESIDFYRENFGG
ncbi:MAG: 3-dehydroquinate synthase [Massilibacteroides sp.]|nr:3-dehydroquinate synthase [Massilibacteroides sp.]